MRKFFLASAAVVMLALAPAAFANGNNGNNGNNASGELAGFVGFGTFATVGQASAVSAFGGQAESFANGTAGLTFNRCTTCGGGSFGGSQTNEAGALTAGNAFAFGNSQGAAQGAAGGGFIGGFTTRGGRR